MGRTRCATGVVEMGRGCWLCSPGVPVERRGMDCTEPALIGAASTGFPGTVRIGVAMAVGV